MVGFISQLGRTMIAMNACRENLGASMRSLKGDEFLAFFGTGIFNIAANYYGNCCTGCGVEGCCLTHAARCVTHRLWQDIGAC